MNQEYGNFIKNNGIYLEEKMGVKEWAFTKDDALKLLQIMKDYEMSNLGGDVIREINGNFEYARDNWHTDRNNNESAREFSERSIHNAEQYIKAYPEKEDGRYYFVLA